MALPFHTYVATSGQDRDEMVEAGFLEPLTKPPAVQIHARGKLICFVRASYCLAQRALKNAPQRLEVASRRVLGHNENSSQPSSVFAFRLDPGRTQSGGDTVAEPPHRVQADFGADPQDHCRPRAISDVGGFLGNAGLGSQLCPARPLRGRFGAVPHTFCDNLPQEHPWEPK